VRHVDVDVPGLAPAFDGLRIAQLSGSARRPAPPSVSRPRRSSDTLAPI
jgi:hypothetical protein